MYIYDCHSSISNQRSEPEQKFATFAQKWNDIPAVAILGATVALPQGGQKETDAIIITERAITLIEIKGIKTSQPGIITTPEDNQWMIEDIPLAIHLSPPHSNPLQQIRQAQKILAPLIERKVHEIVLLYARDGKTGFTTTNEKNLYRPQLAAQNWFTRYCIINNFNYSAIKDAILLNDRPSPEKYPQNHNYIPDIESIINQLNSSNPVDIPALLAQGFTYPTPTIHIGTTKTRTPLPLNLQTIKKLTIQTPNPTPIARAINLQLILNKTPSTLINLSAAQIGEPQPYAPVVIIEKKDTNLEITPHNPPLNAPEATLHHNNLTINDTTIALAHLTTINDSMWEKLHHTHPTSTIYLRLFTPSPIIDDPTLTKPLTSTQLQLAALSYLYPDATEEEFINLAAQILPQKSESKPLPERLRPHLQALRNLQGFSKEPIPRLAKGYITDWDVFTLWTKNFKREPLSTLLEARKLIPDNHTHALTQTQGQWVEPFQQKTEEHITKIDKRIHFLKTGNKTE